MGEDNSPRINLMSYKYSIYNFRRNMIVFRNIPNSYDTFVVEENIHTRKEWSINRLKKNIDTISKNDMDSFIRTRKWIQENHPELLL